MWHDLRFAAKIITIVLGIKQSAKVNWPLLSSLVVKQL